MGRRFHGWTIMCTGSIALVLHPQYCHNQALFLAIRSSLWNMPFPAATCGLQAKPLIHRSRYKPFPCVLLRLLIFWTWRHCAAAAWSDKSLWLRVHRGVTDIFTQSRLIELLPIFTCVLKLLLKPRICAGLLAQAISETTSKILEDNRG